MHSFLFFLCFFPFAFASFVIKWDAHLLPFTQMKNHKLSARRFAVESMRYWSNRIECVCACSCKWRILKPMPATTTMSLKQWKGFPAVICRRTMRYYHLEIQVSDERHTDFFLYVHSFVRFLWKHIFGLCVLVANSHGNCLSNDDDVWNSKRNMLTRLRICSFNLNSHRIYWSVARTPCLVTIVTDTRVHVLSGSYSSPRPFDSKWTHAIERDTASARTIFWCNLVHNRRQWISSPLRWLLPLMPTS